MDLANNLGHFSHSLYITPKWVESVASEGYEPIYLDFEENGIVVAKISGIIIIGNLIQGKQLYFYSGPALKVLNNTMYQNCFQGLLNFAKANSFTRISVRPWDQLHGLTVQIKGFRSTITHEYEVDLNQPYNDSTISSRILRNIKKARKNNAQIRESSSKSDLDILISFLESTKNRRVSKFGSKYTPFYVFNANESAILRLLENGMAKLYCAEIDSQVQSIMLMLDDGERTYNMLKGSADAAYTNGVSSFLDFEVVKIYIGKGFKIFNLGVELSETEGQGLNLYKEGLGGNRIRKHGAFTYYLNFPYKFLNLIFYINNCIPDFKWILVLRKALSSLFSGANS